MAQASNSEGTSKNSLNNRLDEQFFYLLPFFDDPISRLTEEQKSVAKKWLVKLGTEPKEQSFGEKLQRNSYLIKLMDCICDKNLRAPFNEDPSIGKLTNLSSDQSNQNEFSVNEHFKWLDDLKRNESNSVHIGGRNFETYLATKLFDEGRGACAYLSVSVQNEGSSEGWMKMRPNEDREKLISDMFDKELNTLLGA